MESFLFTECFLLPLSVFLQAIDGNAVLLKYLFKVYCIIVDHKSILVKFHVFRFCLFKGKKIVTHCTNLNTYQLFLHAFFSSSDSFVILALFSSSFVDLLWLAKINNLVLPTQYILDDLLVIMAKPHHHSHCMLSHYGQQIIREFII